MRKLTPYEFIFGVASGLAVAYLTGYSMFTVILVAFAVFIVVGVDEGRKTDGTDESTEN